MALSKDYSYLFGGSSVAIHGEEVVMTLSPEMQYIDFHTHWAGCEKYLNDDSVIVVQSLHLQEAMHPRANYITIGVHPMLPGASDIVQQYRKTPEKILSEWSDRINNSSTPIIAIGECGWDNRSPLSAEAQNQLVDFQVQLALLLRLPMVFHIVGGWHYLLKKHQEATTPWIVHGFRGKSQLANQLTEAGIFLSLHPLSPEPPNNNYLLETDDSSNHVRDQYQSRGANCEEKFNLFSNLFLP
ncbi:MAG: TatD family hydrolase [Bacteroidales bacterium]|uniref:TatD family hydrolase n=1 Tax=Porphyromonas sp. TaxID=1924944 RepID=UPI0029755D5A|nr:TatD family hydrolase [Porphyromonas sp.]MDD7437231.1 TatD family hydrolase [Bacteroidales bacterium]MDY3066482.1 TatD family hydrolase [Porphyromonas sp.]